jgi:hypothetical protein
MAGLICGRGGCGGLGGGGVGAGGCGLGGFGDGGLGLGGDVLGNRNGGGLDVGGEGGDGPHLKSGVPGRGTLKVHKHSLYWSPVPQPASVPFTMRGFWQVAGIP